MSLPNILKSLPKGTLLKNSAKPLKGFHYDHPLDGHGYINSFTFDGNSVKYKGYRQQTAHYKNEKKAGVQLYRGLATNSGNPLLINNFSNVSVFIDKHGDTYSCGEGGVPYHFDIDKEITHGPQKFMGLPDVITTNLPFLPLSAHPQNFDDHVYNFGCFNRGIYIMKDHRIDFSTFFERDYYAHDFKVTQNYFVVYLNAINMDLKGTYFGNLTILDSIDFTSGSQVLIIDKTTYETTFIPIGSRDESNHAMHIATVKEVEPGTLELHACISNHMNINDVNSPYDFEGFKLSRIHIDIDQRKSQSEVVLHADAEMPVVDKGGIVYLIDKHALYKYDTNKCICSALRFDSGVVIEEPCVVDGFVFVIGHSKNKTQLYSVDAATLKILHTQVFDFEIPYGFHGAWKSQIMST